MAKYLMGHLYLTSTEVKILTGLSTGQLNGAIQRGNFNPIQTTDSASQYFDISEVLEAQKQVWLEGRIGDANLRRQPVIRNSEKFTQLCEQLERDGWVINDLVLVPHPTLEDVYTLQDPSLRKTPDRLPFSFEKGNAEAVYSSSAASRFESVKGCFCYADETNKECTRQCDFYESCCAARFSVLEAIAGALESGKPHKNPARRAQVSEYRRMLSKLELPSQGA